MNKPELKALFERLCVPDRGAGEAKLRAILQDFYARMSQDILIGHFFEGKNLTAIATQQADFLLRAMKDSGKVQVLSRPQIVTADNKIATINIGQRVPLITDSRFTEQTGTTTSSYRYEDVGVNLSVTPKISPDGWVKMDIGTTNSSLSSSVVAINGSASVPIINTRRANTTVSAQSGQTILIGGLISTQDDKRVKKMPVLGDIPLLGVLFRSTHTSHDRKELLIMLTPQILAHGSTVATTRPMDEVAREQLDKSALKEHKRRDRYEKDILEPIFPPTKKSTEPITILPRANPGRAL